MPAASSVRTGKRWKVRCFMGGSTTSLTRGYEGVAMEVSCVRRWEGTKFMPTLGYPHKISEWTGRGAVVHCRPLNAASPSTEYGALLKKKGVVAPARTWPLIVIACPSVGDLIY